MIDLLTKFDPKILLTHDNVVFWPTAYVKEVPIPRPSIVGIDDLQTRTTAQLKMLTPAEMEACVLHFVEGRTMAEVAEWLRVSQRMVREHIRSAVVKAPALAHLRVKSRDKIRTPKQIPFSQFGAGKSNPFSDL